MSQKNESLVLFISLIVTILLLGTGFWWLRSRSDIKLWSSSPSSQDSADKEQAISTRLSTGEKILTPGAASNNKQSGVAALAAGNYEKAIADLEAALKENRNDPEALIYLNNARIGKQKAYMIAAVVPMGGSNPNNALEMLRGFAQAQNEVNQSGGINGVPLKLLLANDDDNLETAKQLATTLVKNPEVLAVTGHWTRPARQK